MPQPTPDDETPLDVAEYLSDIVRELAAMARRAGLATVANALDQAQHAAASDAQALQSGATNAAPDDAA